MENNTNTAFPYDIFPIEIMMLLENAEETLNFPIEYLASSILSASSVAIGNTYNVKFKEGFIVKPNLYLALVGNAGDVKSHPLKFAYEPIEKIEKAAYIEYIEKLKEYNSLPDEERKRTEKPIYKKTILKDFTPEALIKMHSNNNRGVSILSDELFGWIKNFGRYSSSGEQETYLSLWNGSSISVDRKSDEPIRLDNTCVNIIGTIQTKILPELGKDNRGNNGFIERMLFALNENPKPVLWSYKEINKKLVTKYETMISRLLTLNFNNFDSNIIELTENAKQYLINWQNKQRKEFIENEVAYSIQAKYEVYAIRISLIIQLMYWAIADKTNEKIELFAIEKSIQLVSYFFDIAMKINNKINNYNPKENLTDKQKSFYCQLGEKFTTQQALSISEELEIPTRTTYRLLKNKMLFSKKKHGEYIKIKY